MPRNQSMPRRRVCILYLVAGVLPGACGTASERPDRPSGSGGAAGLTATLSVAEFDPGAPAPASWISRRFADSVAARLKMVNGLTVIRDGRGADFILKGSIAAREGRLVLNAQLWHRGDAAAAWTATFWRSPDAITTLVEDVSTAAAGALYAELARRSVLTGSKR